MSVKKETKPVNENPKVKASISRAEGIQQREQLR